MFSARNIGQLFGRFRGEPLHLSESCGEFRIRFFQRDLRVNMQKSRNIDSGKQQVAASSSIRSAVPSATRSVAPSPLQILFQHPFR